MTFEPADPTPDAVPPAPAPVDELPGDAVEQGLPPDARRRLIERFESWLDRVAAGEPPPPGIPRELLLDAAADDPTESGADLYSVFASLTGLTGEVRLQGRAFKQLADLLGPLARLPEQFDELSAALMPDASETPVDTASLLPSQSSMLELVLDLYDRLGRGLRNADAALAAPIAKAGWFGRSKPVDDASAVRAMRDGYAMTLSRVAAALQQWDVTPIGSPGEPFDPRRMIAIDVRAGGDQPSGTVVEVNRSGCSVRGTVVTPAQVTVAK